MQNSFLKLVAEKLIQELQSGLENCVIIFPNKRPIDHLKRALESAGYYGENPEYYTIEEFINAHAITKEGDSTSLLLLLYKIYLKYVPGADFDGFYGWGNLMLKDYDDIDKYMVDPQALFKNLSAIKDLEKNFMSDAYMPEEYLMPLNPDDAHYLQERFQETWQLYAKTYVDFKEELKRHNLAYSGMNYRYVAENFVSGKIKPTAEKYIFIGFNALSKAEEEIIRYLLEKDKVLVYWDADSYYLENEKEEAGYFIRRQRTRLKIKNQQIISSELLHGYKDIHIIGAPLLIGQAKTLGYELKKNKIDRIDGNTVIVMPDENLLMPVLHALAMDVEKPHISPGYPLPLTYIFSLFQSFIDLQENYEPITHSFYHKDILAILSHPVIRERNLPFIQDFLDLIMKEQMIYVSINDFVDYKQDLLALYLKQVNSAEETAEWFRLILADLISEMDTENKELGLILDSFTTILDSLQIFLVSEDFELNTKTYLRLFKEKVVLARLNIETDGPGNIDIMGMLETRCLDFENVYILSVNEGILPGNSNTGSYIPYDLRMKFDMPVFDEQDNLYAYYFYRLLQRAQNVYLIYNSETGTGGVEKSRYIRQIEQYLPAQNSHIKIHKRTYALPLVHTPVKEIVIAKNEAYYQALVNKNNAGFSPSFISAYHTCSLQFYFNKILNLPEKAVVIEDMEAKDFGLMYHAIMEKIYSGLIGNRITAEIIDQRRANLVHDMEKVLDELHKSQKDHIKHKNSLLIETIKILVDKTLESDKKEAPFKLIALEKKIDVKMPYFNNGIDFLHFKGTIDRIDEKDGLFRIVDYKTGAVKANEFNFNSADFVLEKDNKEAFQTLFYSYMFLRENPEARVQAVILPLKEVVKGYILVNEKIGVMTKADFIPFENKLKSILDSIFDAGMPISQTENHNICSFCSYRNFCMR